jgi:hypothetical protein
MEPRAGVHVAAEIAVIRPLALAVVVMQVVAEPKVPTLALTVARVRAPEVVLIVASPEVVKPPKAPELLY